ncbi:MAG: biotin/lipoyl-containing protein [bacterium]|nr:biotin/lipoyl-containing protein [bacterium]
MNKIREVHVVWEVSEELNDKTKEWFDVIEILIKVGDNVQKQHSLATIENEKGTGEFSSPLEGEIKEILVKEGGRYHYNDVLCTIEEK